MKSPDVTNRHRPRRRHGYFEPLESRVLLSTVWDVTSTVDDASIVGTLRNAIVNSQAGDIVQFDPAVFTPGALHTIALNGTDLAINHDLTIQGPGAGVLAINGSGNSASTPPVPASRIFEIDGGATVVMSGLTVTGGQEALDASGQGGGILDSFSVLTLNNCTITGNSAGNGGGIYNIGGTVTLSGSTLSNNSAPNGFGGGIYSHGNLNVTNSTIAGNSANSTDPTNPGSGGGIFLINGSTEITGSTFSGNLATNGMGGAIFAGGGVSITNSTFAGNSAAQGGAAFDDGDLLITNCTVDGNSASSGGGIYIDVGEASAYNSIVAGNFEPTTPSVPDDVFNLFDVDYSNPGGASQPLGNGPSSYNIIGDANTSGGLIDGMNHNIVGHDPKLAPLANYGGPTQTMALFAGSPALDGGSTALAVDDRNNPLSTDQRGLQRVFGKSVDIGAYEAQPPALAGDVNHDGTVNFTDLVILAQHYNFSNVPLYENGDLTGDGIVNFNDLVILAQNYGKSAPAPAAAAVFATSAIRPQISSDSLSSDSSDGVGSGADSKARPSHAKTRGRSHHSGVGRPANLLAH